MKSTDNLDRIVKAIEKLPDNYETEHALKKDGYVEGICDSINAVLKLLIHSVSNTEGKSNAEITYNIIKDLKQMLINNGDEELANKL